MSDFMVTTTIERPKQVIPSAQQPGAAAPPRFTIGPTISEPRKSGAKPTPAQVKAKRLAALRVRQEEIGNTDLLSAAAPKKTCSRCDEPARGNGYCIEHKREVDRDWRARKAQGAAKKLTALRTRQATIAVHKSAQPVAPTPTTLDPMEPAKLLTPKYPASDYVRLGIDELHQRTRGEPTAGMRREQLVIGVRTALRYLIGHDDAEARDAAMALFDGLIAQLRAE